MRKLCDKKIVIRIEFLPQDLMYNVLSMYSVLATVQGTGCNTESVILKQVAE